jgi:hypothetical protein
MTVWLQRECPRSTGQKSSRVAPVFNGSPYRLPPRSAWRLSLLGLALRSYCMLIWFLLNCLHSKARSTLGCLSGTDVSPSRKVPGSSIIVVEHNNRPTKGPEAGLLRIAAKYTSRSHNVPSCHSETNVRSANQGRATGIWTVDSCRNEVGAERAGIGATCWTPSRPA